MDGLLTLTSSEDTFSPSHLCLSAQNQTFPSACWHDSVLSGPWQTCCHIFAVIMHQSSRCICFLENKVRNEPTRPQPPRRSRPFHPGCAASRGIDPPFPRQFARLPGQGTGVHGMCHSRFRSEGSANESSEGPGKLGPSGAFAHSRQKSDGDILAFLAFALTGKDGIRDLRKSLHCRACCVEPVISQVRGRLFGKQVENFRMRWPASHFSVGRWARGAVDLRYLLYLAPSARHASFKTPRSKP